MYGYSPMFTEASIYSIIHSMGARQSSQSLPVRFSMSMLETVAPKSMPDSLGRESGCTETWEVIVVDGSLARVIEVGIGS